PKGNDKTISVKKLEMERALRRVSVFSREKTNAVHFNFSAGQLSFYAQSPEFGEAEDQIAAVYEGEKISTGFNSRYVLEALSVIENDEIQIEMKDPLSPVMLKDPGDKKYLCVVMPMRI
ncbi:MAG TPA: DNA polymerase III subunit beta, partial [Nitrospiria bacterium]|nr:DNA polymerase III subunit beta [Nitrospiria bacterium]